MKNFYFLCALPRSGATLLSSIINQSNQIKVSPNSVIWDILSFLIKIKTTEKFLNFPYHRGIDLIIANVFNLYYSGIKEKNILDKAPWGDPYVFELLKQIFTKRKFIILIRPILECLASFIRAEKPKNIEERCDILMSHDGMLGSNILSIQNLIKQKEDYIIITYDDFIKDTQKNINKIFNFLNLQEEKFNLNNFFQYSMDNTNYDDEKLKYKGSLHKLRTNVIEKNKYNVEDYLPQSVIDKYGHIKI
jgi:hypothetical protein